MGKFYKLEANKRKTKKNREKKRIWDIILNIHFKKNLPNIQKRCIILLALSKEEC